MTTILPPNQFDSGALMFLPPDEAAALSHSHAPGAAADIQSSCGGGESRPATEDEGVSYLEAQANALPSRGLYRTTGEEAPSGPRAGSWIETAGVAPGPQEAIDCIGEIFAGARKLEPIEMWFENTAYPREDELLYEVLKAMDDPHTADLIEMPYGMEGIFDPPPLFLQQMRA